MAKAPEVLGIDRGSPAGDCTVRGIRHPDGSITITGSEIVARQERFLSTIAAGLPPIVPRRSPDSADAFAYMAHAIQTLHPGVDTTVTYLFHDSYVRPLHIRKVGRGHQVIYHHVGEPPVLERRTGLQDFQWHAKPQPSYNERLQYA